MVFDILTLFPNMFTGPFDQSILRRAKDKSLIKINLHNLRNWAIDKRGTVDDRPYGGGVGMILRIEPIYEAIQEIKKCVISDESALGGRDPESSLKKSGSRVKPGMTKTVLLDPRGQTFTQAKAREYSQLDQLILICGHYEGVDERVREHLVDETISIGNYVLTGGEIPAIVIVDTVTRLIPGALEKPEATQIESFSNHITSHSGKQSASRIYKQSDKRDSGQARVTKDVYLEYAQYTRPEEFMGWKVPEILLSGNHKKIEKWRKSI